MEDMSKKEVDRIGETPNAEEELDCKTIGESSTASSMETENFDRQSTSMIREDIEEIKEENNDQLCEMNRIIQEIVKTAERHGLTMTNSANWNEVPIPENFSLLLVSNLESPQSRITEDTEEIKEDNNLSLEIHRIIEEIVKTAHQQGMSFTNSGNWSEVTIPEYCSRFLVSNLEESPESGANRSGDTPHTREELDCKTVNESNIASSMLTKPENMDKASKPMISEDIEEIHEDINDQLCEIKMIIEDIVKIADRRMLSMTNSANGNEVPIPEYSSQLVRNLESPESRISEEMEEIGENNNDLLCELTRLIEEIVKKTEQDGMTSPNSEYLNEVTVPENSSRLVVKNLEEPPKYEISEDTEEIREDINDQLCEIKMIIEDIVKIADRRMLSMTNSVNGNEVPIPEYSSQLVRNLESPESRISEDIEEINEDNNDQLAEITRLLEELLKTEEHDGMTSPNFENSNDVTIPENSSWLLVNNEEESSKYEADIMGETSHTKHDLDCNTVGESNTASSMRTESENLDKLSKSMAISSEETSENQNEDTKQYFTMNNIKEDLKKSLKHHGLTITDFVLLKGVVSKNSSILTVRNLENPQVDLANDNGGSQEQLQFHQCKPKACMSPVVQDVQQIFQKHGMTLEKATVSGLIQARESPSSSDTEKSDDESVDFPKPPAKTQQKYKWYMIAEMVKEGKNQLSGPSGTNPGTSNTLDDQDQVVSSSESDTDE